MTLTEYEARPAAGGNYPIERKTTAGATAAAVGMFVLWIVCDALSTHGSALDYLPPWLAPIVVAAVPALSSFAAGWLTKHQRRTIVDEQPNIIGPVNPYLGEETTPNERTAPPGAHRRTP